MAKNVLNFDQFMTEKKHEYIEVTAFGKTYKVKKEIPAIVPIMLARAGEKPDNADVGLAMMKAGDIMFGEESVNEMCMAGASTSQLAQLFRMVFQMISGQDVDGDDMDEAEYDDTSGKVVRQNRSKK